MRNYLKTFTSSSCQTKIIIFFLLAFGISTLGPIAYFYARLGYTSSEKTYK